MEDTSSAPRLQGVYAPCFSSDTWLLLSLLWGLEDSPEVGSCSIQNNPVLLLFQFGLLPRQKNLLLRYRKTIIQNPQRQTWEIIDSSSLLSQMAPLKKSPLSAFHYYFGALIGLLRMVVEPGFLSAKTVVPKSNNKGTSRGEITHSFPHFSSRPGSAETAPPSQPRQAPPPFSSSLPSHSGLVQQTSTGGYYLQFVTPDPRARDVRHCLPARPCWRGSSLLSALMPGSIQTRPPMRRATVPSFLTSEISPKGKTHGSKTIHPFFPHSSLFSFLFLLRLQQYLPGSLWFRLIFTCICISFVHRDGGWVGWRVMLRNENPSWASTQSAISIVNLKSRSHLFSSNSSLFYHAPSHPIVPTPPPSPAFSIASPVSA